MWFNVAVDVLGLTVAKGKKRKNEVAVAEKVSD